MTSKKGGENSQYEGWVVLCCVKELEVFQNISVSQTVSQSVSHSLSQMKEWIGKGQGVY